MKLNGAVHRAIDQLFRGEPRVKEQVKAAIAASDERPPIVALRHPPPENEMLSDEYLVITRTCVGVGWPMVRVVWERDP